VYLKIRRLVLAWKGHLVLLNTSDRILSKASKLNSDFCAPPNPFMPAFPGFQFRDLRRRFGFQPWLSMVLDSAVILGTEVMIDVAITHRHYVITC
jgi:hypothetical protein